MKAILFHNNEGIAIHDVDQNYSEEQINEIIGIINSNFEKLGIEFDLMIPKTDIVNYCPNGKLPDWDRTGITIE